MIPLLVVLSITSMVTQNGIFNNVCKKRLESAAHINHFNMYMYAVCILIFGVLAIFGGISLYTLILGLVFGVVTALSNYYKMRSLSTGPMHVTLLITTSSMIIPTMSGVFFSEEFSLGKLLFVCVLLFFIYLSLSDDGKSAGEENSSDKKKKWLWVIFCAVAFLLQGTIGVLQKIHQSSQHKAEVSGFLFIAFICSLVFSRIRVGAPLHTVKLSGALVGFALICGVCTFLMNFINLYLSGVLPTQLFFPLVNGSSIVLSSLMSVVIFKEHLSKKQLIGLVGGVLSLIAICLVP